MPNNLAENQSQLTSLNYAQKQKNQYIVVDHFRAVCFIIADGVKPSGKQRGYVLRKLIRRSFSAALKLKIPIEKKEFWQEMLVEILKTYSEAYPELTQNQQLILDIFMTENAKYLKAIKVGQREWKKYFKQI